MTRGEWTCYFLTFEIKVRPRSSLASQKYPTSHISILGTKTESSVSVRVTRPCDSQSISLITVTHSSVFTRRITCMFWDHMTPPSFRCQQQLVTVSASMRLFSRATPHRAAFILQIPALWSCSQVSRNTARAELLPSENKQRWRESRC